MSRPTSAFKRLNCVFSSWADQYLSDTMGYLLGSLKKEKERTAAFQALGLLVVAVRVEIQPYLAKILEIIKAALPPKDFAHKSVNKLIKLAVHILHAAIYMQYSIEQICHSHAFSLLFLLYVCKGGRRQCKWMRQCSPVSACCPELWVPASNQTLRSCWSPC